MTKFIWHVFNLPPYFLFQFHCATLNIRFSLGRSAPELITTLLVYQELHFIHLQEYTHTHRHTPSHQYTQSPCICTPSQIDWCCAAICHNFQLTSLASSSAGPSPLLFPLPHSSNFMHSFQMLQIACKVSGVNMLTSIVMREGGTTGKGQAASLSRSVRQTFC